MTDPFQARTLKRKNVKGLALNAAPKPASNPTDGDAQAPGLVGNSEVNNTDTLEIGLEFRLDLRSEDLVTLKELGAGNGGTVSKVMHYENFESDMTATVQILSLSMVHSKTKREILYYAWNIWILGRWTHLGNKEDIPDRQLDLSTAFLKISALFESMCWGRSPNPSWPVLSTYTKPTASCIVTSSRPISY